MVRRHRSTHDRDQRGASIIELMVALAVLAVGILAVGQLFPAGTRGQQKDRMTTSANLLAQERMEQLRSLNWFHADLSPGTHGPDSVGTRYVLDYTVTQLASPMDRVKRVDLTVSFSYMGSRSVTATSYLRR